MGNIMMAFDVGIGMYAKVYVRDGECGERS